MKSILSFILPLSLCLAGVFTACDRSSPREIHVLHIEGVEWACNITSSFGTFGSSYETEGENELTLAASKGDLLYMLWGDEEFYYRYHPRDGHNLNVLFDTVGLLSIYLNEKLNYMELTGKSIPAKFKDLSRMELSQLSTLNLDESLISDLIPLLEEHESQMQGMGLVLDLGPGSEDLREWLSKFQPEFLILEDPRQLPAPGSDYALEGLELLWIQEYTNTLARAAQCCGDLESLILSGWEAKAGELLPLSSMKNLQNLTLAESDMASMKNIELPESLHSLNLISCTNLESVDPVLGLPELCRLSLTGCEKLNSVDILQELEYLRWISFPTNTSQGELQSLSKTLNQVELVELIGCTEITELDPLRSLENLNILALDLEEEQLGGLDLLKQLELLIVSDDLFVDNSDYINDLRASLPDTKVVPGSGLCLGSGWLLLLLPLILIFRFFFRQKIRSSAAA